MFRFKWWHIAKILSQLGHDQEWLIKKSALITTGNLWYTLALGSRGSGFRIAQSKLRVTSKAEAVRNNPLRLARAASFRTSYMADNLSEFLLAGCFPVKKKTVFFRCLFGRLKRKWMGFFILDLLTILYKLNCLCLGWILSLGPFSFLWNLRETVIHRHFSRFGCTLAPKVSSRLLTVESRVWLPKMDASKNFI